MHKGLFRNYEHANIIKISIYLIFLKLLMLQIGYKRHFFACRSHLLLQKFMESPDFTSIYVWRTKSNDITVIEVILQKKRFYNPVKNLNPNLKIPQMILKE